MTLPAEPALEPPRLPGDLAIWFIILIEMATFGLLFATFAVVRAQNLALFAASQGLLDAGRGAINTWLLIGGSGCVVLAVRAVSAGARRAGVGWLLAAQGCGLAFLVLKGDEYARKLSAGIDIETNVFFTLYYILTGFHFFHVVAAMAFLAWLTLQTGRGRFGPGKVHALETGAAFWHMVDLLWIVLFPLVYILR
jgi:nitric oxide reductase NorE protein